MDLIIHTDDTPVLTQGSHHRCNAIKRRVVSNYKLIQCYLGGCSCFHRIGNTITAIQLNRIITDDFLQANNFKRDWHTVTPVGNLENVRAHHPLLGILGLPVPTLVLMDKFAIIELVRHCSVPSWVGCFVFPSFLLS